MALVQVKACGVFCSSLIVEAEPQRGRTGRCLTTSASEHKHRGEALRKPVCSKQSAF